MKRLMKSLPIVALMVSAFMFNADAQTAQKHHRVHAAADSLKAGHRFEKLKAILTTDQQALLQENHKKQKAAMIAFKSSLTDEQKAIMKDKALPHKERRTKLAATFTADQKQMVAANKEMRKANRKAFFATLSDEQKTKMKELRKDRREHVGFRHHKAEKA